MNLLRRLLEEAEDIDPERLRSSHPEQGLSARSRGRRHRRAAGAAVRKAAVARLPADAAPKGWCKKLKMFFNYKRYAIALILGVASFNSNYFYLFLHTQRIVVSAISYYSFIFQLLLL